MCLMDSGVLIFLSNPHCSLQNTEETVEVFPFYIFYRIGNGLIYVTHLLTSLLMHSTTVSATAHQSDALLNAIISVEC